ncbi:MAG: hypothetical protein RLZZ290_1113 [Pseudomonadota bacterium]
MNDHSRVSEVFALAVWPLFPTDQTKESLKTAQTLRASLGDFHAITDLTQRSSPALPRNPIHHVGPSGDKDE